MESTQEIQSANIASHLFSYEDLFSNNRIDETRLQALRQSVKSAGKSLPLDDSIFHGMSSSKSMGTLPSGKKSRKKRTMKRDDSSKALLSPYNVHQVVAVARSSNPRSTKIKNKRRDDRLISNLNLTAAKRKTTLTRIGADGISSGDDSLSSPSNSRTASPSRRDGNSDLLPSRSLTHVFTPSDLVSDAPLCYPISPTTLLIHDRNDSHKVSSGSTQSGVRL
jgi:hypothetical protein